ncbi:MAG: asparagine synthase (glutamine-hydrolyzing) [Myxococcales bacterium]|nr:asparagine synthase (glutamine-hydrolyzing) [Myxococcales bacterium]
MCGIVGLVRRSGASTTDDRNEIERMRNSLRHRGPDGAGLSTLGRSVLGHQRLAVVDIDGGHQPMEHAHKPIQVVFNGEIYNHAKLRQELEADGVVFRTSSDTEVIPYLYERLGPDFVEHLDGMFALAVWDNENETLVLARDRVGQKPLYWTQTTHGVYFASELRALLESNRVERSVDQTGMRLFLRHDSIPAPHTIYAGVFKVEPGAHLVFTHPTDPPQVRYHYNVPLHSDLQVETDPKRRQETLWNHIVSSVDHRLMADVPLGMFLSGGIDSTVILAAMAECLPAHQIKSFSIGFEDESYDESDFAKEVAQHFGVSHQLSTITGEEAVNLVPEVLGQIDEPFADPSIVPTWILSAFAREQVTVALSGDGGDELFRGYPTFRLDPMVQHLKQIPQFLRGALPQKMAQLIPQSPGNQSASFLADRFSSALQLDWPHIHFAWITGLRPPVLDSVLHETFRGDAQQITDSTFQAVNAILQRLDPDDQKPLGLVAALYVYLYLSCCVLQKVDRASMAHGLEARAPLLSPDVIANAFTLPNEDLMKRGSSKRILRNIVQSYGLSDRIISRPKKGFGIPVADWLRGPLRTFAEDLLTGSEIKSSTVLDADTIANLWGEHLSGARDHRKELWALLAYRVWEQGPYGPLHS